MRKAAAMALVEIGEPAIEPLIAAIKEENEDLRQAVVEALVKIGEPALERAVERLIVELEGEDDDVRGNAIEALVEIGEPAVESLIAALSDKSLNVRRIVVSMILMKADNMEVIPHYQDLLAKLNDVLRDKGFTARGAAAGALGKIGDTRAIEPLIAALKDDDLLVRWAAAGALFVLRDARALEPLATLKQDDLLIRGCLSLVLIGDARTVKPLIAKLMDEDDDVRQTATEVLKKLGWEPA